MSTKNCPYCGEEILSTAKKCKHCSEWLEEKTDTDTSRKFEETLVTGYSVTHPNYKWLSIACYIAICFAFVTFVVDFVHITNRTDTNRFNIAMLCEFILFIYLLLGLRQCSIANKKSKDIPFIAYIVAMVVIGFFSLLIPNSYFYFISEEAAICLVILLFLLFLCMGCVLGFKLKEKFPEASNVGIVFIIYHIVFVLSLIIEIASGVDNFSSPVDMVMSIILYYNMNTFFIKFINKPNKPNKHKKHNTIKEFGIFLSWLFVIALIIKFVLIIVHPTLE